MWEVRFPNPTADVTLAGQLGQLSAGALNRSRDNGFGGIAPEKNFGQRRGLVIGIVRAPAER